ncbi:hypothetical protein TUMEXPCC7403_08590 [Tumidithrix helvetica PCC 7403]
MARGANDYLTKPIHVAELLEAIATRRSRKDTVSAITSAIASKSFWSFVKDGFTLVCLYVNLHKSKKYYKTKIYVYRGQY